MVPYKVVPCKYDHYCIALLFVCCILWAPPYANAQRFDVRPRGDIARHQRYIPVLQALDKAAEEAVQACQTANDQMTWAMAQMAIQAFHAGNKATQDRPGGDEEACSMLDQAVAMLGGQPENLAEDKDASPMCPLVFQAILLQDTPFESDSNLSHPLMG